MAKKRTIPSSPKQWDENQEACRLVANSVELPIPTDVVARLRQRIKNGTFKARRGS